MWNNDTDTDVKILAEFSNLQYRHLTLAMDRVPAEIECNQVLRGKLWIGDMDNANDEGLLKANQITAIVSLGYKNTYRVFDHIAYHRITVDDDQSAQIIRFFDAAVDFIHAHDKVLVHCVAGVSRSASICMAFNETRKAIV
jgi:Dual specificity phosphatase, catalytic domain